MLPKGLVIGVVAALVLSIAVNVVLFIKLQRSPEIVYIEKPVPPVEAAEPTPVVVHISGAVARPNVYSLPAGSRVLRAVEAAGGALSGADLNRINLARVLVDGEQVHIYLEGDASAPAVALTSSAAVSGKININAASQKELESLPGIGPAKASDIILHRTQNGPFKRVEDIVNVRGIGEKTFESLKDLIRVN